MWTPTPWSADAPTALAPMPRIWKLKLLVKLLRAKVTFGIACCRLGPPSIFCAARLSWLKADTAIGTSCSASSFFWAVTTSSSMTVVWAAG